MKERHWLNKAEGHAFIEIDEESFTIGDCNKIVTLEFSIGDYHPCYINNTPEAIEYKIDILYDVVKRYRTYIKKQVRKAKKANEVSKT